MLFNIKVFLLFISLIQLNDIKKNENKIIILENKINLIYNQIDSIFSIINNITKKKYKKNTKKNLIILNKLIDSLRNQQLSHKVEFILNNPDSLYSLELLQQRIYMRPEMSIDSIKKIYLKLSKKIKETTEGYRLNKLIKLVESCEIFKEVPYFEYIVKNDKIINPKLLKIDSIFYLIYFGASWCKPCNDDIPYLKIMHKKYRKYNFKIIHILREENMYDLNKYVIKKNITDWYNFLSNDTILNSFHVPALPTKYLINNKGKIIGRWRGGGVDNLKNIEIKIKQNLIRYQK